VGRPGLEPGTYGLKTSGDSSGSATLAKPLEADPTVEHGSVPLSGACADCVPFADPVETALADALTRATEAGQWTVVETLSRELTARREARAQVVNLESERARRGARR